MTTDTNIVHVRQVFTLGNRENFKTALLNTPDLSGGEEFEESTDECLNTVVHALGAADRLPGEQIGNFSPSFGLDNQGEPAYGYSIDGSPIEPMKFIILITDDAPGGFKDKYTETVRSNALAYASEARSQGIGINAITVNGGLTTSTLMLEYANVTCGWFSPLVSEPVYIRYAIANMLGDPLLCSPLPFYP